MKLIEFFCDTKHKRASVLLMIFNILVLKECVSNMMFVFPILSYSKLENLYNLAGYADLSFIGRLLFNIYLSNDFSFVTILLNILRCFSLPMILIIIWDIYYILQNYQDRVFNLARKYAVCVLVFSMLIYAGGILYIVSNLTLYTSYNTILSAVHNTALWVLSSHAILYVTSLFFLLFIIRDYIEALEYKSVEMNEFGETNEDVVQ